MSLAEKKRNFLDKYRSKKGFKRYLGTPLRYAGGKSLAVGLILEMLPDDVKRVVSPFIGGGSVEVACSKELGIETVGYDIFEILTTYWQVQIEDPKGLYRRLKKFSATKEDFKKAKEKLKAHWKGETTLGKEELAAIYYFTHNTSYGPQFLGWPSSVYMKPDRYQKMIEKARDFNAGPLRVEKASFEESIEKHQGDFLYCDPPYFLGGDSKMFIGMYPQRNFPVHHNGFKHEVLRDLLKAHKGGFILSYNDCSTIREWYKDFEFSTPSWQYTMGQGESRIGENRIKANRNDCKKDSHEILIWRMP